MVHRLYLVTEYHILFVTCASTKAWVQVRNGSLSVLGNCFTQKYVIFIAKLNFMWKPLMNRHTHVHVHGQIYVSLLNQVIVVLILLKKSKYILHYC